MISPLQQLSVADLGALSRALGSGRLSPPFSPLTVQRYCAGSVAEPVAIEMQRMIQSGSNFESIALLLDVLADERSGSGSLEDVVDIVWSGPEGPGVASRDTATVVRELFTQARDSVLVAGYAVYQGHDVFRALAERMDQAPDLTVKMFLNVQRPHGDSTRTSELLQRFAHRFRDQQWPGKRLPEVFYDPRSLEPEGAKRASLHAKCLVVDSRIAFVSSANFTEAAQERNIEVGVLIQSASLAQHLARHFLVLAEAGALQPLPL